ncbi:tRNA lysidine(34) synthetase TilS [Gilvibacter sediminis]|uniref:tRNA lysidine(34) synthetase TilS n=1 Tax=Gilvibacter sediminis TaxID=379071 RepID=UPI0023500FC8|nr:tRNA lysidine(34) synthetase TilS [Gilvibacter sediminis]MDC7998075.1 tRNA lysidine(34) synthetase TilS [Gilvibacter sediminis]
MLDSFSAQFGTVLPNLKGKRLLLAVSGGMDSCVLLDLMRRQPCEIAVAHCNYQLRGADSDADHQLVKELALQYELEFHEAIFDTQAALADSKESLQMLARRLRYDFFETLITEHNYDYLLTAHHADDSLETFIINWNRGSGVKGLQGIPRINGNILRPLLDFDRKTLLAYANDHNLQWREDRSNASEAYLRNEVRLKVVPVLKDVFPQITQKTRQAQRHLNQTDRLAMAYLQQLEGSVWAATASGIEIYLLELMKLETQEAVLYHLLSPYGFTDWNAVYSLPNAQSGAIVYAEEHQLLKDRDLLILDFRSERSSQSFILESAEQNDHLPIKLEFKKIHRLSSCEKDTIVVDADLLEWPLSLRRWQAADRFIPFGMQGSQKLSDYFINQKISRLEKEKIWLLCSDSKIVWVIGHRADDRFKVSNNTKNLLQIKWRD